MAHNFFSKPDNELNEDEYNKLSRKKKELYEKVAKEALIYEHEHVITASVLNGPNVTVRNLIIEEVWGKTAYVIKKNLIRTTESSKSLLLDVGITTKAIYYKTFSYTNSWFSTNMKALGDFLYPGGYEKKSIYLKNQYKSGPLLNYLNYLK